MNVSFTNLTRIFLPFQAVLQGSYCLFLLVFYLISRRWFLGQIQWYIAKVPWSLVAGNWRTYSSPYKLFGLSLALLTSAQLFSEHDVRNNDNPNEIRFCMVAKEVKKKVRLLGSMSCLERWPFRFYTAVILIQGVTFNFLLSCRWKVKLSCDKAGLF